MNRLGVSAPSARAAENTTCQGRGAPKTCVTPAVREAHELLDELDALADRERQIRDELRRGLGYGPDSPTGDLPLTPHD